MSLRKYEYRYRSSYSRHISKSGKEFYGIMVTIFETNAKEVMSAQEHIARLTQPAGQLAWAGYG